MQRILRILSNNTTLSLMASTLAVLLGLITIAAMVPTSDAQDAPMTSKLKPNQDLALGSPYGAEEWVQSLIKRTITTRPYQVEIQRLDLDQDGVLEILVSEASPMPGVFIPRRPVQVLEFGEQGWQLNPTDTYCRPERVGNLRSNGYWDLECRSEERSITLRWDGRGYRPV